MAVAYKKPRKPTAGTLVVCVNNVEVEHQVTVGEVYRIRKTLYDRYPRDYVKVQNLEGDVIEWYIYLSNFEVLGETAQLPLPLRFM